MEDEKDGFRILSSDTKFDTEKEFMVCNGGLGIDKIKVW